MKTTEELEEIYDSEPYEWIALWKNRGVWVKIINPSFIHGCHYQLIHIKHKDILEAYLADNSVEIEALVSKADGTGLYTSFYRDWDKEDNFIENYNPELEYRLKEKEDEHSSTSSDIDTTMDNSVDSDNIVSKMTIPIKNHWYDNPANFPVRLVRDTEQYVTYRWVYKKEDFIKAHRQGFKLVTEDNCTLIRGMF